MRFHVDWLAIVARWVLRADPSMACCLTGCAYKSAREVKVRAVHSDALQLVLECGGLRVCIRADRAVIVW